MSVEFAKPIEMELELVGTSRLQLMFPEECSDITLDYQGLFRLANAIGSTAYQMPMHPSDPGQDEAEADFLRVGRCQDLLTVIYFREKTRKLVWSRNVALIVAEKMAKLAETIAGEREAKRR